MRDRYASLREGLVGAWIPSVSGSGLLMPDLSGNGNNGKLTNMGPEDWVSGKYGRALDFDGSNDKVADIGQLNSFSFIQNTGVFAISFWAKFDTDDTRLTVLGNEPATVNKGFFVIREYLAPFGNNAMRFISFRGVSNTFVVTGTTNDQTALAGKLDHWCFASTYQNNIGQWYLNGVAVTTTSKPGTTSAGSLSSGDSTRTLSIGVATFTSDVLQLDGQLDDIRIYNRALSEPEIKLLASRPGIGLKPQRRTMYYAPPTGARRRRILTSMP